MALVLYSSNSKEVGGGIHVHLVQLQLIHTSLSLSLFPPYRKNETEAHHCLAFFHRRSAPSNPRWEDFQSNLKTLAVIGIWISDPFAAPNPSSLHAPPQSSASNHHGSRSISDPSAVPNRSLLHAPPQSSASKPPRFQKPPLPLPEPRNTSRFATVPMATMTV
ncbi:hypothetical protein ACLB2K_001470 [Fragaria x ananassa]